MGKYLCSFLIFCCCHLCAENSPEEAEKFIDSGHFTEAELILKQLVKEKNISPINKARIYKNIGTVKCKLGRSASTFLIDFKHAISILTPLTPQDKTASEQLGYVLYQQGNCLLSSVAEQLRLHHLQGFQLTQFFPLLKKYIEPAQRALSEAEKYYPANLKADIYLLEGDLELQLARIYLTYKQIDSAKNAYNNAEKLYQKAITYEKKYNSSALRPDLLQKAYIQKSVVLNEKNSLDYSDELMLQAIDQAKKAKEIRSDNDELNISATLNWVSLIFKNTNSKEINYAALEKILLQVADKIEDLRKDIAAQSSFSESSKYFSTRTGVYELLLELYAIQNKPEKMLEAVEQMKARALKDLLNKSKVQTDAGKLDIEKLKKSLANQNAGLVEYFYGPAKAWMIFVSPKTVAFKEIPCTGQELVVEISKILHVFSDFMKLRIHVRRMMRGRGNLPLMEDAYKSAYSLYQKLLMPINDWTKKDNIKLLYIVPHHIMNYLPFSALLTEINDKDLAKSKYYVENGYPLAYLPSASILAEIESEKYSGDSIFFARTDFSSYPPNASSNLQNTIKEVESVSHIIKGKIYAEKLALEDVLLENRGTPHSVLYFATHGILKDNPLDSHILLTASDKNDGKLTVSELFRTYNGKLKTDMLVLSACQTNRGEINPSSGDDLSTLGRAFLVAGSKTVIATQWDASDDTFPKIMCMFMRNYIGNNKRKKAVSMQNAIKTFISKPDAGFYRYPIFWGNIVLIGDGS